jgi:hypothetical protein
LVIHSSASTENSTARPVFQMNVYRRSRQNPQGQRRKNGINSSGWKSWISSGAAGTLVAMGQEAERIRAVWSTMRARSKPVAMNRRGASRMDGGRRQRHDRRYAAAAAAGNFSPDLREYTATAWPAPLPRPVSPADDPMPHPKPQLTDRSAVADAALMARLACGDPGALDPLYGGTRVWCTGSRCSGPAPRRRPRT